MKLPWQDRGERPEFLAALQALAQAADAVAGAALEVAEAAPEFPRLHERAQNVAALARSFEAPAPQGHVRWLDLSAHQARLVQSPLDIRELFSQQRSAATKAWIFTSATLGTDAALSWFTQPTGLHDARTLVVGSPFDYEANARVWVPTAMPQPHEPNHSAQVGALAARLALVLGGRTFVLTTTLRALQQVAQALAAAAPELTVLVQGTEPRRALLQRYGRGERAVLVGSQSFWEGIDMPGDALQCVLIDKLPFPPPADPWVKARTEQIRLEGGDPFTDYFEAEAAISLKQGAGRLIRTVTDQGLLVLCDPRLLRKGYGKRLMAGLPPMGRVDSEEEAMQWLAALAAKHSPFGSDWPGGVASAQPGAYQSFHQGLAAPPEAAK